MPVFGWVWWRLQNSYLVGSLSVVMFTLSYYVAFPPLVRNRCLPLLSQPQQHSLLTHREQYDVIVPYNASWLTHRSPQFRLSGGHDVLVFLHMQVGMMTYPLSNLLDKRNSEGGKKRVSFIHTLFIVSFISCHINIGCLSYIKAEE